MLESRLSDRTIRSSQYMAVGCRDPVNRGLPSNRDVADARQRFHHTLGQIEDRHIPVNMPHITRCTALACCKQGSSRALQQVTAVDTAPQPRPLAHLFASVQVALADLPYQAASRRQLARNFSATFLSSSFHSVLLLHDNALRSHIASGYSPTANWILV
jgi:hypothetical protein